MRKAKPYNYAEQKAYREGQTAAKNNASRLCPNYPSFDEKAAWRRGFDDEGFQGTNGFDIALAAFFSRTGHAP